MRVTGTVFACLAAWALAIALLCLIVAVLGMISPMDFGFLYHRLLSRGLVISMYLTFLLALFPLTVAVIFWRRVFLSTSPWRLGLVFESIALGINIIGFALIW